MPAYPTLWRRGTPTVWSDLFNTRREMDNLFDRFFTSAAGSTPVGLQPVVDVRETDHNLEVVAELPGLRSDDVEVNLENNVLTISGEKKQETSEGGEDASYHLIERSYGRFERSFTLPRTVDISKVKAQFENGVLTVSLPKMEEAKPRRIKIDVTK